MGGLVLVAVQEVFSLQRVQGPLGRPQAEVEERVQQGDWAGHPGLAAVALL